MPPAGGAGIPPLGDDIELSLQPAVTSAATATASSGLSQRELLRLLSVSVICKAPLGELVRTSCRQAAVARFEPARVCWSCRTRQEFRAKAN